jgi:hypothetical protein
MTNVLNGTTYIISFDLGAGANIDRIVSLIKSYGTWAKITENSWAVVSVGENASQVRDKIIPYLGVGGRLFVIKSGYESAWLNPNAKSEWLKKYLEN